MKLLDLRLVVIERRKNNDMNETEPRSHMKETAIKLMKLLNLTCEIQSKEIYKAVKQTSLCLLSTDSVAAY